MLSPTTHRGAQRLAAVAWAGPRSLFRLGKAFGLLSVADWDELVGYVEHHRPRYLSFDVFDTCLVRSMTGDVAVEVAIANRGEAEAAARVERELCDSVPAAVAGLKQIRSICPSVVFLSDTDRSSGLLEELLVDHGLFQLGDVVVASCEAGATKSDGDLYTHPYYRQALAEASRCSLSALEADLARGVGICHVGNNLWSDGVMAAAGGVVGVIVEGANPSGYEQVLTEPADTTGPAIAGAARRVRLSLESSGPGPVDPDLGGRSDTTLSSDRIVDLRRVGIEVAGPAVTSFVVWAAQRCRENDIDHVAFLARDGELFLRAARAIPADHWQGRSLEYLHCSRMTWSLASASVLGVERWVAAGTATGTTFLNFGRFVVPFYSLLKRVGLQVHELGELGHRDLARLNADQPLPLDHGEGWRALLNDARVQDRIGEQSDGRRQLILDFLAQQGFPRGSLAMVDVGWTGRLAWQTSAVISQYSGHKPLHLHFGGDKASPLVDSETRIERFSFNGYSSPSPVMSPVSCVETFTASGRPRALGYRREADGTVGLLFDDGPTELAEARVELWSAVLEVARSVPGATSLERWGVARASIGDRVIQMLGMWWNTPSRREALALASLSFERDEAGTRIRPIVAPYGPGEVAKRRSAGQRQWSQGSEAVTAWPVRFMVRTGRRLERWFGLVIGRELPLR